MSAGQRLCQSRWLLCVWRGCLLLELGLVGVGVLSAGPCVCVSRVLSLVRCDASCALCRPMTSILRWP